MTKPIHHRDVVDPAEGEKKYGDVEFADQVNNTYPIDTEGHVRAAWSCHTTKANADEYTAEEVERIKGRNGKAARRFDIDIAD